MIQIGKQTWPPQEILVSPRELLCQMNQNLVGGGQE